MNAYPPDESYHCQCTQVGVTGALAELVSSRAKSVLQGLPAVTKAITLTTARSRNVARFEREP